VVVLSVRRGIPRPVKVLALAVLASVTASGAAAYAGVVTTGSVIASARTAISKQTGAHVVFTASAGSSSTAEKIVADVGVTSGAETITEGTAHLAVRVTPTFAYVSGNSSGLTSLFGESSTDAKKIGTDWESWKAGTSQYSNLKSDVTMTSIAALLPKAKGTKLSSVVTKGTKLYVLKWTTAATSSIPKLSNTLTVSTGETTLPVEGTTTASGGTKATTTLSRWGEHVLVSTPPAASVIASSKVTG
jgi:hypothetical protein